MNNIPNMKQSKKVKIAPESAVKVTSQKVNDTLGVIDIEDKLMTDEHFQMLHNAANELMREGCKNLIVDLSKIKRINSMGLGSLIALYTNVRNAEGELKIGGVNDFVKNVLRITKLTEVFDTYPSREDAIKSFS